MTEQDTIKAWTAPQELQRRDWEPLIPGGYVDLGYVKLHRMTCEDAKIIAAAQDMLAMLEKIHRNGGFDNISSIRECGELIARAAGKDGQ
jgi:hypothetical protein